MGREVVFIYVETCCAALCHVVSEHPAACVCVGGGAEADVNLHEDVHKKFEC